MNGRDPISERQLRPIVAEPDWDKQLSMWSEVTDILTYLGMPIVAVAVLVAGEVILVSKVTTEEAAKEDFVFTAEAKGVPDREVRDHHVARYGLLPMLNKLMVSVPFILHKATLDQRSGRT